MQIALNGFYWDQPDTGSGQYLRRLWRYLPRLPPAAAHTFVLLRPGNGPPANMPPAPTNARLLTVGLWPAAGHGGQRAKIWWEQVGLPAAARRVGADLLHCPYLAAPLVAFCPTVITVHDLIPWALPAYRAGRAVRLYLSLARLAAGRASLLLTDSEASRRDVLRYFRVPPAQVRTVLLGIEPEFAVAPPAADVAAMRVRFGLPPRYAFYIGGYDRRKDVPTLLRVWAAALPQLAESEESPVLALAGRIPAPGGLYPDITSLAAQLGLITPDATTAPLRLLGRVSEADKRLLLAGATVFPFPSRYEGFGYDPLEAMAAGVPVLATNRSALPEIVGDAGDLLPAGDIPAWSAALVRLWRDPAHHADRAARSRAQAACFDPARTAAATLVGYLDVLRESGKPTL